MNFEDYLQTHQPLVFQTFKNALESKRISHAYLLSGEKGVPLLETATYLAKSLLCDHPNPLACDECLSCKRINHHTYTDFILLDGREGQIKKGDVQEIVGDFSKTPLEAKGIMIYIINLVENMNVQAINSLLKFLEEPPANTYAFLTTENETKVLPTILSRCEKLRMLLIPKDTIKNEAIKNGVKEEDAELLVHFFNNADILKEKSMDEGYLILKDLYLKTLDALAKESSSAIFEFENSILPALNEAKKKSSSSFVNMFNYLDLLSLAFKDALSKQEKQSISLMSYDQKITALANTLPHLGSSLAEILKIRSILNTNINSSLALVHLFLYITEENL